MKRPFVIVAGIALSIGALVLLARLAADAAPASESPDSGESQVGAESDSTSLPPAQHDRSPVDLALSHDGAWLVTANQTSDTASLVGTADGQVWDEVGVGRRPAAVALCPDGRRVLVTASYAGEVVVLEVDGQTLRKSATIDVPGEPTGVVVGPDNQTAYVALAALDQVAVLDLESASVVERIDVGRWPRYLALSPDGSRLAVGVSGDRGVAVVDTAERKLLFVENRFRGLNLGHMLISADGQYVYFPWMHYGESAPSRGNIRRGWVVGNRLARVRLDGPALREAISLDKEGLAVGDAHGLAMTSDEQWIVASMSGTHELLLIATPGLPLAKVGGTEHIDPALYGDSKRFARIDVGGRPLGLRISPDNRTGYVANYLLNAVQAVDLDKREVVQTVALSAPDEPSQARRGEAIFYDAQRSSDQWYSCHSCHYEGGANAVAMDTLNDGTVDSYKTVLPLYHVHETGPWTWHGWQTDLADAMQKSFTSTMVGSRASNEDVQALLSYLESLESPPNPHRPADEAPADDPLLRTIERGREVFNGDKAGCANCHTGAHFTDGEVHDVGLGSRRDRYKGFNTPSLVGVYRKVRLLHDGRARSLEELLTGPHNPDQVTGQGSLSEEELRDLVAYLKSL